MSKVDRIFKILDNVLFNINELFGQSVNSYTNLETSCDEYTFCANDGSMVSVIEIVGCKEIMTAEKVSDLLESLTNYITPQMSDQGHYLQMVMTYDPYKADKQVMPIVEKIVSTSQNIGLDIDEIMYDWGENVSKWCSMEKVFLIAWTNPATLPASEKKKAMSRAGKSVMNSPTGENAQTASRVVTEIEDIHVNYVQSIMSAFSRSSVIAVLLDVHTALWWVRHEIDPEITSDNWKPLLPGDPIPQRMPEFGLAHDKSTSLYPNLSSQLFVREPEIIDRQIVKVGDRLHAPFVISLPPQKPRLFNVLFKDLIQKKIPWRVSFFIDGSGTNSLWMQSILSSVLSFTSTDNKKFNIALEELKERELENECIVSLQISCDTWVGAHEHDAYKLLKRRMAEFASSIQGWGTTDVQEVIGDPMLGLSATVPGLIKGSPAPRAAAPLQEALMLMPMTRPATAWEQGSFLLRSHDGKVMPYQPGSSLQAAWIDIGVSPMGGGKSVFLNSYNLAFLLQTGLSRLPFLSIIDIGPSSRGLILLLQNALPKGQKYQAAYHRLRLDEDHAINPFDTPLGCRHPLLAHKNFLVNLISIFCTPLDKDAPQSGIEGIARMTIDMAYTNNSDEKSPKLYNKILEPEIDNLLKKIGAEIDSRTSWWEVVDTLFDHGYMYEASRAQRHAVPTLADVAACAKRNSVSQMYNYNSESGESITNFFWRCCVESISAYPVLKSATKFDVGDAKVVSLDLMEVAPKGGPEATRQSGVMYMLARHVVGSKFFLMPEDVEHIPDKYRQYHDEKIREIRQDPKRICYDEMHRAISQDQSSALASQIQKDLETAARESRKWNLSIGLYTQNIKDFPDILLNLATSKFVLGSGGKTDRDELGNKLGLSEATINIIKNLGKPGISGANMVAIFATEKGEMTQLLTNSIGMQALWAFSSTTEDYAVRDALYEEIGFHKTLRVLSKLYPRKKKKEVEKRRMNVKKRGFEDSVDVIKEITEEIIEKQSLSTMAEA